VVKAVYHAAWLASRLGLHVKQPLAAAPTPSSKSNRSSATSHGKPPMSKGLVATLSDGHHDVSVVLRPQKSDYAPGTTLRVELLCERRGSELRADVTAQAESVNVRLFQDGVDCLERHFLAARRGDVDLLAEAIESGGKDPVASGMLHAAARLAG
jgi:hypothetical protein